MAKKKVIEIADNTSTTVSTNIVVSTEPVRADSPASVEVVLPSVEVATKDHLLTVTAAEDFKDGALAARFAVLGYPLLWKKGETRSIPMTLLIRCKRSGARFEV